MELTWRQAVSSYRTTRRLEDTILWDLFSCVQPMLFFNWSTDATLTLCFSLALHSGALTCLEVVATAFITLFNAHCCPAAVCRFMPTNPLPGKDFQAFRVQCLHHVLFTESSSIIFWKPHNSPIPHSASHIKTEISVTISCQNKVPKGVRPIPQ